MRQGGAGRGQAVALTVLVLVVAVATVLLSRALGGRRGAVAGTPSANPTTTAGVPSARPEPLSGPLPPARVGDATAFDEARGQVLVFGGTAAGARAMALGDTWTLRGRLWTQQHPRRSPPPLTGPVMVYDSRIAACVLVGGSATTAAAQTWTWDGAAWSRAADLPLGDGEQIEDMAYDRDAGEVVVVTWVQPLWPPQGTRTWTWSGGAWTLRHPVTALPVGTGVPRLSGFAAAGPPRLPAVRRGVVAVSGDANGVQTWLWSGGDWTRLSATAEPPRDAEDATLAAEPGGGDVVMLSALDAIGGGTWAWDGVSWGRRGPSPPFGPLAGGRLVADPDTGRLLLLGGADGFHELWTYDGSVWTDTGGA